jgi:broad specificity phosphatase PhoE
LRAAWLLGYARGADSLALVSARARSAAALLTTGATEGPVLLIGHGIMNRLIARELRAAGWRSNATHRSRYWSAVTFQSP